jgi:transcriptional regulator GlxA family with amidase domain
LEHHTKAHECEDIVFGGGGAESKLLCAVYEYDKQVRHPLLAALPDALILGAHGQATPRDVSLVLALLEGELHQARPAQTVAVNRLIDLLFVEVVRGWADRDALGSKWWRGVRDPVVGTALALLHARPHEPWTLGGLGREVNASRATLTRRFSASIGMSPLAYLAQWRLELAARDLRDTDTPVGLIAHRVGYASEFAFSRAFAKARGVAPGRYRKSVASGQ